MIQPAGTSNANPLRTGTIVSSSDVRSASATSRMRAITSAEGMSGLSTLAMYAGLGKTTSYESHNVVFRPSIGDWQPIEVDAATSTRGVRPRIRGRTERPLPIAGARTIPVNPVGFCGDGHAGVYVAMSAE